MGVAASAFSTEEMRRREGIEEKPAPFIVAASPLISHSTDPRFTSVLNISSFLRFQQQPV